MSFLSPIWLILLAPWALLAIWMMWGRRSATRVPFLDLWRGSAARPARARLFQPPPLAIVAILAAMLLAILAASEPIIPGHAAPTVTVVLDRGITMSAGDRREEVTGAALDFLRSEGNDRVRVVDVPASPQELSWPEGARKAPRTALDTSGMIERAVADALQHGEHGERVIVLSDQRINPAWPIVQIGPTRPPSNVGIVRFAIRQRPTTQAMVAIRNDSVEQRAELNVDSVTRTIDLPERGETRNYFVDLPSIAATSQAQVTVNDELDADNVAWLARQRDWPRIEMRPPLPREVERVVVAYEKARPAGEGGARVVVTSSAELPVDQTAAIVAASSGGSPVDPAALRVGDHPITRNVNWSNAPVRPIEQPADPSFTPIVSNGSQTLIAVAEAPVRRVRMNFDAGEFSRTTEFVVLWTNVLDWLAGGGGETFSSKSMNELDASWKPQQGGNETRPGLYQRDDGAVAAFNASAPLFASPPSRLTPFTGGDTASDSAARVKLLPWLVLAALFCAAVAAYAWPRQRLTPLFGPRTV